jgi:c-di-GMP-binding flagellar brake protein YcgR
MKLAAALVGVAAAVALALLARRARRTAFLRAAAARGLSADDVGFLAALCRRASADPLHAATKAATFERVTAAALAEGAARPEAADEAARIRRMRQALGFHRLPAHAPLLTSRELQPGVPVEGAGLHGEVSLVDERSFTVEVHGTAPLARGDAVVLTVVRPREARYRLHSRLLALLPGPAEGKSLLVLAHDERPARLQRRDFARVTLHGRVTLRPRSSHFVEGAPEADVPAHLVNVSAGGALVTASTLLPARLVVSAGFTLAERRFEDLRAVVLSADRAGDGRWAIHLEFAEMPESERRRLVAAVADAERNARRVAGAS